MMKNRIISCLALLSFCAVIFTPLIASATDSGVGISKYELRRQADEKKYAESRKRLEEFNKRRDAVMKQNAARQAIKKQKSAITKQKVKAYFQGHPFRVYRFVKKHRYDERVEKFYRSYRFRRLEVMFYKKWMDILGIEKFNEMVKNKELVEDNTVLVNAEGKIVGLADDTLEEGTVAVDQDGNTIPIVSSAEGAYNPVFQFMYNGKIYDHGYYRGTVNDVLRIMPSSKWIDYIGTDEFAQKIDNNEIKLDGTGFYDDEGRIIAISDLSLDELQPVFDEFNRAIPNVATYQVDDPVETYAYFHWRKWKCKHGFYMWINKGIVHVLESKNLIAKVGPEYFAKAMRSDLLHRIDEGDILADLDGRILAIHNNQLPKNAIVVDENGKRIQVVHDGETYQADTLAS